MSALSLSHSVQDSVLVVGLGGLDSVSLQEDETNIMLLQASLVSKKTSTWTDFNKN